jgi:hypothetical protein
MEATTLRFRYDARVRRIVLFGMGALVCGAFVACSALLHFDDKPIAGHEDGGPSGPDGLDAVVSDGAFPFDTATGAFPDSSCTNPCITDAGTLIHQGNYCGNSVDLACYAGAATHVWCDDAGTAILTDCDGGCISMPDPHPDFCNPCVGMPSRSYCGKDLDIVQGPVGTPKYNGDILFVCNGGQLQANFTPCSNGCNNGGCL